MNPIGLAQSINPESEKTLEIERYANEPLELVEIRIADAPVTNKVLIKFRRNDEGLDTVTFKERDGWFRHLQIKLRNISGKPIYGVRGNLLFKPAHTETRFSLPMYGSTQFGRGVLEPGADVTLTVTDQAWDLTSEIFKQHNVNPDLASVTFHIDAVRFSDDLQWVKGRLLHPDPGNPNRWIP